MEIVMLAALSGALITLVLLGVEDDRHYKSSTPRRLPVEIDMGTWSETLPTRQSLPWNENTGA